MSNNNPIRDTWQYAFVLLVCAMGLSLPGCFDPDPVQRDPSNKTDQAVAVNRTPMSQNIWLEVGQDGSRRVLLSAQVCLRQGMLEHLLTLKGQKEHEAIFAADIDARNLSAALVAAGATPGSPVRFEPRFRPPTGTQIKITVQWKDKSTGEMKSVSARSLVRQMKTKAELATDWVFAGSVLVDNPFDATAPKKFLANEGDVVSVCNFESALLDLPIESSKGNEDHGYEPWTERIPAEGTKVTLVFEPVKKK